MAWIINIDKVQTSAKGSVAVHGVALGEGKDAKVVFKGDYDAKNKEWKSFNAKTENPDVINKTPGKDLGDVVKEIAEEAYKMFHEKEWS